MKAHSLMITLTAAILLVAGCGILQRTPEEQAAEEARVEKLVRQRLDARKYKVDIDFMQPLRGGSRPLTSPYSVTVNGTHLISYLPYMGVAYDVPYGGGKALNFESEIQEYVEKARNGKRTIEFVTDNGEDVLVYQMVVFDNGRTDLRVQSRKREAIDFRGSLNPDADPDNPDK